MFNKLTNIFLSPYILALVVTLVVALFVPETAKYVLKLDQYFLMEKKHGQSLFSDLDGDSLSEYLISFNNKAGVHALKVSDNNREVIDQWNFSGKHPEKTHRIFTGDYDRNGYEEVYLFSESRDSLLLNIIEPLNEGGIDRRNVFIDVIRRTNRNRPDYSIHFCGLRDIDKDGFQDLVFVVRTGFGLKPRKIYIYNTRNKHLTKSPDSGVVPVNLQFHDIDGDGFDEIFGSTYTTGNMTPEDTIPFPDSSAWFMVYDRKLEHVFDPVEFPGFKTNVRPYLMKQGGNLYFLLYTMDNYSSHNSLMLFDVKGNLLKKKAISKEWEFMAQKPFPILKGCFPGSLVLMDNYGDVFVTDTSLILKKARESSLGRVQLVFITELGLEEGKEHVFLDKGKSNLYISSACLNTILSGQQEFPQAFRFSIFSVKLNGNLLPQLFFQFDSHCYLYSYSKNPYYIFRYLRLAGIYIFFLGFIILIRRLHAIQIRKRKENENKLTELQLMTIRNQITPHFIFNSLNSVSHAIYQEDKTKAYNRIVQLSNLMRQAVSDSKKMDHSLEEELEFIRSFLELERSRFQDKLEFDIRVPQAVRENITIPQMMLQIFVENAVKHGIAPLGYGKIRIYSEEGTQMLRIFIEDNGIGRQKARELNTDGTGTGLEVIDGMIDLYKRIKGVVMHYEVVDLYDGEGAGCGTRVVVEMEV